MWVRMRLWVRINCEYKRECWMYVCVCDSASKKMIFSESLSTIIQYRPNVVFEIVTARCDKKCGRMG